MICSSSCCMVDRRSTIFFAKIEILTPSACFFWMTPTVRSAAFIILRAIPFPILWELADDSTSPTLSSPAAMTCWGPGKAVRASEADESICLKNFSNSGNRMLSASLGWIVAIDFSLTRSLRKRVSSLKLSEIGSGMQSGLWSPSERMAAITWSLEV